MNEQTIQPKPRSNLRNVWLFVVEQLRKSRNLIAVLLVLGVAAVFPTAVGPIAACIGAAATIRFCVWVISENRKEISKASFLRSAVATFMAH